MIWCDGYCSDIKAIRAALASAPDEGPRRHAHRIEYPSRCTGCEHLAADFVSNAPDWMLVGRRARPAVPALDVESRIEDAIADISEEWAESAEWLARMIVTNMQDTNPRDAGLRVDNPHPLAASATDEGPDGPAFMILHNAGRHDVSCEWSRPGAYNAETHPCTCGLLDDIRAIERFAASAPDEVSAAALRLALRTEMGWSVHEVEEFLGQYHLTKPLDEYDSQRIDGEYAALASAPDEGPSHLAERFDHDGTFRHHHDSITRDPIWWEYAEQFGGEKREHRHEARPAVPAPDVDEYGDPVPPDPHSEDWYDGYAEGQRDAERAASAPDEGPLPGQEVGHGCSPECNACRADRLAASAPDEGPREPTWSPTDPSTVEFPVDDGRPAAPAALDGLIGAALDEWNQQATGAQGWPAMAALEAAYSARPAAPATLDEIERMEPTYEGTLDEHWVNGWHFAHNEVLRILRAHPAASATDEGHCDGCQGTFYANGEKCECLGFARPAVPALDVERLAEALDADWSPAWREVPVIGPNGVEFTEARWDKLALAEIVAREYAALQEQPE